MWGRINASLLRVAQGDSSYLMYKSVPLPVDLGSGDGEGRCKLGGGGGEEGFVHVEPCREQNHG